MRRSKAFYKNLLPTTAQNLIYNYIECGKADSRSDRENRGYIWDGKKNAITNVIMSVWEEGLLTISEAEKLVDIYEAEIKRRFKTV